MFASPALALALLIGTAAQDARPQPAPAPAARGQTKAAPPKRLFPLMVGDAAPAFAPKAWVKGGPLKLERGKVYVVDFWSTSGASTRMAIEVLSKLAQKHGDKLTVIGVNGFEAHPDKVAAFVQSLGDKLGYAIALDDAGKADPKGELGTLSKAWMQAAGQRGVPASFLVAGDGRIAFIGHPMIGLDKALDAVLGGTFDFDAASATYAREVQLRALQERIAPSKVAGDRQKQVEAIEAYLALRPEDEAKLGLELATARFDLGDFDAAHACAKKLADGAYKDDAKQLNELAWLIVDPARTIARRDLGLARRIVERSLSLMRETDVLYPGTLDTLGRVYFHEGNLAKARETQERAIALCKDPQLKRDLEATLAEYRK
jgi:tetratricopeptide (TPR) repeat protein